MKQGGILIVEEPDVRKIGVKVLALFEKILIMRSHFLPPSHIASLFKLAVEIQIETIGPISWVVINK